jgi:hypothetical protein
LRATPCAEASTTEEPDAGIPHVRGSAGGAGQPAFLPRNQLNEVSMTLDKKTDAEILRIVNPIMDNLMEASTKIDHVSHTRDFTDRLKAIGGSAKGSGIQISNL